MSLTMADVLSVRPSALATLRRLARRLDPNRADDLLSAALVSMAQKPFDPSWGNPMLITIGKRLMSNAARSERALFGFQSLPITSDNHPGRHSSERLAELRQLLNQANSRDRQLMVGLMRGLTSQEMAAQLAVSPAVVKMGISRMRTRLASV